MLAFTEEPSHCGALRAPLLISVVMVIGGLTIGFVYGVDAVAGLVDPAFGLFMSEGWWRRAAVALIAFRGAYARRCGGLPGRISLSLPLLDRLALAVERHDGWTVEGRSLGLGTAFLRERGDGFMAGGLAGLHGARLVAGRRRRLRGDGVALECAVRGAGCARPQPTRAG